MKNRTRRGNFIVSSIAVIGLAFVSLLTLGGLIEEEGRSDFAIVFGNKVHENGLPSRRLKARLDRAGELFQKGRCHYIIVSGGIGVEGHDEAVVMKKELVERGLPGERIVVDSEGWTTWDSARNAHQIAEEVGVSNPSAVTVSQFFHLTRCRLALRRAGFEEVSSSFARYLELRDIYSLAREIPAFMKYLAYRN